MKISNHIKKLLQKSVYIWYNKIIPKFTKKDDIDVTKAVECAAFFIYRKPRLFTNTYDGNSRLQKLLFFANYISLADNGELLFPEKMYMMTDGCVTFDVWKQYKYNYKTFINDCRYLNLKLSQRDINVLVKTEDIFGNASTKELSDLSNSFSFFTKFDQANLSSRDNNNEITKEILLSDVDTIREVLSAYNNNQGGTATVINGVRFYIDAELLMNNKIQKELARFAATATEEEYSVYMDGRELVIY